MRSGKLSGDGMPAPAYDEGMVDWTRITHAANRWTHSTGPRLFLNYKIARYGHVTELKIDDQAKTIDVTLMLKGESAPIEARVTRYVLTAEGEHGTITVGGVTVSREWMQTLANEIIVGKPLPLPPGAAKWLNLVL